MRAGERVDDMFAEDAEIRGFGNHVRGKAAIAEIYAGVQDNATPQPEIVEIVTAGNRAFGEVQVALADGTFLHVVDVFEVEHDLITSLTYFNGDYPPTASDDLGRTSLVRHSFELGCVLPLVDRSIAAETPRTTIALGLLVVVLLTPSLDVLKRRGPAVGNRIDMVELEPEAAITARFGARRAIELGR